MQITTKILSAGKIIRHYVYADGKQIGYIELAMKKVGYGESYYANHRAVKGDSGTEVVSEVKTSGDTVIIDAVIEAVKSNHPELDLDVALLKYATNAVCFGCKPKTLTIPN